MPLSINQPAKATQRSSFTLTHRHPLRSLAIVPVLFALFALAPITVDAHGCMNHPNQRGSLTTRTPFIFQQIDANAPVDYHPHFPAGPISPRPGTGLRAQMAAAGRGGWTPYEPFNPRFVWRSGVCGDQKHGPQEHLKGGKYYYNGKIVATYRQGSTIEIGVSINAHHNGFMELHLCDASKCPGGDISPACFHRAGACRQLKRARNSECDSGTSRRCAPIDRNFPGRWYLPCTRFPYTQNSIERFGVGGTMRYQLPSDVSCDHCVLQWFWTAANSCNPPGVIEYYDGPDRPRAWGNCWGQAGAKGGVAREQRPCGGLDRFPEEYLQCADIRITRGSGNNGRPAPPPPPPGNNGNGGYNEVSNEAIERARKRGGGAVRALVLIADGRRVAIMPKRLQFDARRYKWLSVEAIMAPGMRTVRFGVNGRYGPTVTGPRFLAAKNGANPAPWAALSYNKWLTVSASGVGDSDSVALYIVK